MENKKELIVITGAAGGIGQACIKSFKDHALVLTDYSQEQVDEIVDKYSQQGFDVVGIPCDITDEDDLKNLVEFVSDKGIFKALVHTAGVSGTVTDLKKVFTIDLVATDLLINSFYEIAEKGSVAILLASMMGHTVPNNEEYDKMLKNPQDPNSFDTVLKYVDGNSDTMYNFAKKGVRLLVKEYVNKWGEKGARIISVSPGVIETPMALKAAEEHPEQMESLRQMTPLKRNGKPEDVADIIHCLASDNARFINGTDILVDGGVIHNIKKRM